MNCANLVIDSMSKYGFLLLHECCSMHTVHMQYIRVHVYHVGQ